MYLSHLSLNHFRNYQALELDFQQRLILCQGLNAQGKTNLLEAIYFLATSKATHAQQEREIVGWQAQDEPIPYTRVMAQVQERAGDKLLNLEIVLTPREGGNNFKKQIKINGVPKRSMDLVGTMRSVLFLPEDIKLVSGSPGERRRYLDVALCQIDRTYCRTLSAYQKVLTQRNSLLKNLREQGASPNAPSTEAQLGFWDEQLVAHGSLIIARRNEFVAQLQRVAQVHHGALSNQNEQLMLHYLPSFNPGLMDEGAFEQYKQGENLLTAAYDALPALSIESVTAHFNAKLQSRRAREMAAGITLYGPHRDDLRFLANRRDLRTYGSRGQQRTAALSLKLAEVQAMTEATGTTPILLLDDVMSELDAQRRSTLLATLQDVEQVIITTTDWNDFTSEFRLQAQLLQVDAGTIRPHTTAI